MKWTVILFLMVFFNSHVKSQNFAPALSKNEIQNLVSADHSSSVNFLANEIILNADTGIKDKYCLAAVNQKGTAGNYRNIWPEIKETKFLFVTSNKKNEDSKNKSPSKMYMKLYGGYGIFTPGSFKINTVYFLHDTAVRTQTKKGLGSGLRYGGGIGVVMNDFLNIGIDAEYHKGSWEEKALNARIDDLNYNIKTSKINYTTISLTPHVIFKALAKPKYFIYNKLGILLTLPFTLGTSLQSTSANNQILENDLNAFTENLNSTTSEEYKISLGVGLNVALGVNLRLSEKLRIFSEVFGNYSALSPRSSVEIDYSKRFASLSYNTGNSEPLIIKQISTITTNTTYEKGGSLPANGEYSLSPSFTVDDYTQTNVGINTLAHKFTINMAVLGVNLGIIYRF
ncbi:MAG: hypothetical protein ABJA71_09225 [Ginsengibacter sp.]